MKAVRKAWCAVVLAFLFLAAPVLAGDLNEKEVADAFAGFSLNRSCSLEGPTRVLDDLREAAKERAYIVIDSYDYPRSLDDWKSIRESRIPFASLAEMGELKVREVRHGAPLYITYDRRDTLYVRVLGELLDEYAVLLQRKRFLETALRYDFTFAPYGIAPLAEEHARFNHDPGHEALFADYRRACKAAHPLEGGTYRDVYAFVPRGRCARAVVEINKVHLAYVKALVADFEERLVREGYALPSFAPHAGLSREERREAHRRGVRRCVEVREKMSEFRTR